MSQDRLSQKLDKIKNEFIVFGDSHAGSFSSYVNTKSISTLPNKNIYPLYFCCIHCCVILLFVPEIDIGFPNPFAELP